MLRTVHLHGRLGERFGKQHRLDVTSAAEAIRALAYQLPGFELHVREGSYAVTVGSGSYPDRCSPLSEDTIDLQLGRQSDIHIAPEGVVAGIETILLVGILAFTVVASLSMVLMMRAPKPGDREEATKVASHIFDGAENVIEQGHPVPLVYGEMRVGSIVASSGIVVADLGTITPPGGKSAGPGAVENAGATGDASTLDGTVGSSPNYPGNRTPFPDETPVGSVPVSGGGKSGSDSGSSDPPTEDPNSLQSAATARLLEIVAEGEIVGLVNGMKSIYLDDTALQNPDGTFNYQGVHVEQRVGLPDQSYVQGFAQTETTTNVSTQVKVSVGPITRSITNSAVGMARVTIRVPALMETDTTTGDITGATVELKISVQADGGGFTDVYTMVISGKTNTPYERSVQIVLPPGSTRDVRVTRVTPDSTVSSLQNDTYWAMLTEVVEAKLSYPDTALVAMTVDARQFGTNIPTRSYLIRGRIIEVPSNYNTLTRAYTGVWDGTFKRAWTNNPAWIVRDLITNRRYGLGGRVPASAVDKWGLYAIAQHCDGLVPDGKGGQQPRYTINCCINNAVQAYDLLASMAGAFRGMVHWSSGSIVFTQDRPEDPAILLSPSNVVGGKFRYGRLTPHDKRRSVAVVYWNDPADHYKLTPAVFEDPELIRKFGRRTGQEVAGFGITNEGLAARMARWIIEDEKPSSNGVVNYEVGDDHSFISPGKIAMVADPMFTTARRGGRVKSATADTVTLDRVFPFLSGQTYTLRVMLPDGSVRTRAVTNGVGDADLVTLAAPSFTTPPNPGAVWTLESNTTANRQFRIRQIATDEAPYPVRGVLHDPTKYDRVELGRDLAPPDYFELPTGPLKPPYGLGAVEFLLPDGTATIPCALFGWTAGDDPRVILFQAQYRRVGAARWIALEDSNETSRTVRNIAAGNYELRVRGVDKLGRRTPWIIGTATMDGQADSMPEVISPGVVVNEGLFSVKLTWFRPADSRPLRFQILYDAAGVFANAVSLGTTDRLEHTITEPGTYWVRTTFIGAFSPAPVAIPVASIIFSGGIVPHLTNDSHVVPAGSDGVVTSYAGATGSVVIMSGKTDISANFTLSTPTGGNPQGLVHNYVDRTYTITGGLDAAENNATLIIRSTGSGAYAGVVLDKTFTLAKSQRGSRGWRRNIKFLRRFGRPGRPVGVDPVGWAEGIPSGRGTVWQSMATFDENDNIIEDWTMPEPITAQNNRGPYDATAIYHSTEVVTHNGGTYIGLQDNFTGQAPSGDANATAYWDVMAAPGSAGAPATAPSGFVATINLTSGAAVNLRTVANNAGYTGLSDATITFKVPNTVVIRGLSGAPGGIGIDTGVWPTGYVIALTLIVENGGIVDGGGGKGGDASGGAGGAGGDAIYLRQAMSGGITINAGGIVRGGGGGGGAGKTLSPTINGEVVTSGGGGGGGGFPNGVGGLGDWGDSMGQDGAAGTLSGGGLGGNQGAGAREGGNGGNAALAGEQGGQTNNQGLGGAAGYAVRKNGKAATVTNNGTMVGTAG